jgi:hypothetical protein
MVLQVSPDLESVRSPTTWPALSRISRSADQVEGASGNLWIRATNRRPDSAAALAGERPRCSSTFAVN